MGHQFASMSLSCQQFQLFTSNFASTASCSLVHVQHGQLEILKCTIASHLTQSSDTATLVHYLQLDLVDSEFSLDRSLMLKMAEPNLNLFEQVQHKLL